MSNKYHEDLIPYLYEGVYIVNKQRKITFWNQGSERITGYKAEEVVNSYCYHNILQHIDQQGNQLCLDGCPLQKTLEDGIINEAHVFLKHKEGYRIPVMVKTLPIYAEDDTIVAAIEVFTDERFQQSVYQENIALKDQLKTDPLTQVANRHYFDFQIAKRIEEAKQFNTTFGVLIADIDHFKHVNDTYGHLIGDEILKIVANSLISNISAHDIISRWGGEEFVGIIDTDSITQLNAICEKLRKVTAASSYQTNTNETLSVTISIGATLFHDKDNAKTLLERADVNMYEAKKSGRNQCIVK